MSDNLPTAEEIILSLEKHPELMKEVRRRLVWTCRHCGGKKEIGGKTCPACQGTGSLPTMILLHRQTSMRH